ncbi:hypothetical protein [uncultured Brachyspira sp.]|uniref:hypothetical protein n=1 Tax=uncultured Brachyspira sp. TaxID=221953 RepID=UPI0025D33355|nr:hypothetical protein [uncultured Brachyspira sp.]
MIKKILFLFICFTLFLYAELSNEAKNILKEIESKNTEYYSGNRLVKVNEAKSILEKIDKSNFEEEEKVYLKIETYILWANISIANGTFEEDYITLSQIYKDIKKDKYFTTSLSYGAFADFANSLTSLGFFNNKYPYSIIVDMYNYSRLALLKDSANFRAKQIYGMWQIATLSYYNNNTFYSVINSLNSTDNLPDYMIYRAYIYRSMAYMKVNETEKAFTELENAKKMYPNGFYGYLLQKSYDSGKDGFLSAEGADF